MIIYCATDEHVEVPYDKLVCISLDNLNLHRAELEEFDLTGSSFLNSNLRGAFLFKAILKGCIFDFANLIVADLRETNLKGASLKNCLAISTLFENANLYETNFEGAKIDEAKFKNADLRGANMLCSGIESAFFENVIFDDRTIWPKGFDPLAKGMIKK